MCLDHHNLLDLGSIQIEILLRDDTTSVKRRARLESETVNCRKSERRVYKLYRRVSIYRLPPCRNYSDALFRRRQLGHVVERIEQRTAGPRLRPATVVAVRAVLVGQLGQASPRVARDVRAVAGQVLVDVVEGRSRVGATGAGEGIKDEVGAEEVACFGTGGQVRTFKFESSIAPIGREHAPIGHTHSGP